MRLTSRDISHGWSQVKNHVGRAWATGKHALSQMDRYANVAGKLLSAASPLLSKEIQDAGQAGLGRYARGRGQVQDAVNRFEGVGRGINAALPDDMFYRIK